MNEQPTENFLEWLPPVSRRRFCAIAAATVTAPLLPRMSRGAEASDFRLRYIIGSSMYGYTPLNEILPDVRKTGATAIDIWPKSHGNQREQLDELGEKVFSSLLKDHDVSSPSQIGNRRSATA